MHNIASSKISPSAELVTPGQLRAARAFLRLTADELAARSSVTRHTINAFEAEKRTPHPSTLAALQRALEMAGVRFIGETGVEVTPTQP